MLKTNANSHIQHTEIPKPVKTHGNCSEKQNTKICKKPTYIPATFAAIITETLKTHAFTEEQ